jgi:hypothetical protein
LDGPVLFFELLELEKEQQFLERQEAKQAAKRPSYFNFDRLIELIYKISRSTQFSGIVFRIQAPAASSASFLGIA